GFQEGSKRLHKSRSPILLLLPRGDGRNGSPGPLRITRSIRPERVRGERECVCGQADGFVNFDDGECRQSAARTTASARGAFAQRRGALAQRRESRARRRGALFLGLEALRRSSGGNGSCTRGYVAPRPSEFT